MLEQDSSQNCLNPNSGSFPHLPRPLRRRPRWCLSHRWRRSPRRAAAEAPQRPRLRLRPPRLRGCTTGRPRASRGQVQAAEDAAGRPAIADAVRKVRNCRRRKKGYLIQLTSFDMLLCLLLPPPPFQGTSIPRIVPRQCSPRTRRSPTGSV